MNFFNYIGISRDEFVGKYLETGLVSESVHKEFPLNIFSYSRKTVAENLWDGVTSKCRGIIINRNTEEIVARPFEKFHNYGSTTGAAWVSDETMLRPPAIIEKVDGFMATLYKYNGKSFIASKGSFNSIHAKWATAEYNSVSRPGFPEGWTPVFEGVHSDLRIVIDYGKGNNKLVLLALINNETGEEYEPEALKIVARENGFETAAVIDKDLIDVLDWTTRENTLPGEGYVLTWYNKGMPPTRLKLKYIEYLRLHRMVTGVSPKRIWEVLSQAHLKSELDEYVKNSTPKFSQFVTKWVTVLNNEYSRLSNEVDQRFSQVRRDIQSRKFQGMVYPTLGSERKAYALEFTNEVNKDFSAALFRKLDSGDVSEVIWKKVKEMTSHGHPLVDIHNT